MKINILSSFTEKLADQVEYIAKDKPKAARKFKNDIIKVINTIAENPYLSGKSIYFDDENIRELVFKGYKVVFRIKEDKIEVFGFLKQQNSIN